MAVSADDDRGDFDHGYPYWPVESVRVVRCPECRSQMQIDVTIRGDGLIVCPKCYKPFDPEDV
jgi:hypothetical protein